MPTLSYTRDEDLVHVRIKNMTNHELREVLVGLWCRLDADDRADHIRELEHYHTDPDAFLSKIAAAIKSNPGEIGVFDLSGFARKVQP